MTMTIEVELTHRQLEVLSSLVSRALEVKDLFKEEIHVKELEELDRIIGDCFFNEMDKEMSSKK